MDKEIKIAVAISSRLRNNNDVSLQSIVNYFTFKYPGFTIRPDYFVHLNRKRCSIVNGKQSFSQDFVTNKEFKMVKDILRPKKFIIEEDYSCIKNKIKNIDIPSEDWLVNEELNNDYQRLYALHSQEESIRLVEQYEKKNRFTYDLVFKFRPDLYVEPCPHVPREEVFDYIPKYKNLWESFRASWSNTIDVDKLIICLDQEIMNGHLRFVDFSFFGTSKAMKLFSYNYIDNYIEYYKFLNKEREKGNIYADNFFTPESFMTYPITKNKMNLVSMQFFKYILIRKNYIEGADFDQLSRLFYSHEEEEYK